MSEPVFVAIEGIDASGKTTLTAALASALRHKGLVVAKHKEPSRGPVGEFFRRMSKTGGWPAMTMALLSSADRYQQQDCLNTARQGCQIVLADRYYLSGLTYHAVDGIDPVRYQQLNRDVTKPDAYLYLDITPALAATRKYGAPDDCWEERDFALRLPAAYDECLALVTDTEAARVIRIDASKPPHAVLDTALAAIRGLRPDLLEGIDAAPAPPTS
jgi:dTMP kinase